MLVHIVELWNFISVSPGVYNGACFSPAPVLMYLFRGTRVCVACLAHVCAITCRATDAAVVPLTLICLQFCMRCWGGGGGRVVHGHVEGRWFEAKSHNNK